MIPTKKNADIGDQQNNPHRTEIPDKFYVGSTKRSIKTRLNEHIDNWNKKEAKTALIEYCLEEDRHPDWTNIKIVGKSENEELRIAEKIIEKTKNHNCNVVTGALLPYPWRLIIEEEETAKKDRFLKMKKRVKERKNKMGMSARYIESDVTPLRTPRHVPDESESDLASTVGDGPQGHTRRKQPLLETNHGNNSDTWHWENGSLHTNTVIAEQEQPLNITAIISPPEEASVDGIAKHVVA